MEYRSVHIGKEIESRVLAQNLNNSEFGRLIGVPKQNIKRIFEKHSIDTDRLAIISQALNFNFFSLYYDQRKTIHTEGDLSPATDSGKVDIVIGDTILNERLKFAEKIIAEKDLRINELKERIEELKTK